MVQALRVIEPQPFFRAPASGRLRRAEGDFAAAAFEAGPSAQYIIDASGEVRGANAAGRHLFAGPAGAFARSERVSAHAQPQFEALLDLIRDVIRTQRASREVDFTLAPELEFGMRVCPLGPGFDAALLIVHPREQREAASPRERFGFTPSESLVAERLARGLTVPQIALQLGITVETVRCHLKGAFVKAGVHRQAELVSVMLGG